MKFLYNVLEGNKYTGIISAIFFSIFIDILFFNYCKTQNILTQY